MNGKPSNDNTLQEIGTERPTEVDDDRFTKVNNDIIYNSETTKDEEKTENFNQNIPLYSDNKQVFNIKIIVLGDLSAGKTSLIRRYITNKYSEDVRESLSCEFQKKTLEIDENTCANLQIWDTA